ncbi:hypothetical protein SAMN05444166_2587 [Singulisphaera sp. GP187]|uniref:PilW family protein n=1 Tax=Singulisphaera sp. GP187 TaxID=1882752 RepID=UPI00092C969E|nr:prepilin-type N-terminal cleavage/methylation domain-containing protein [Singulisphaera sp. GP187]SIO12548.1 hypothetical protein SAMN05444166_2587 [Singulisphaera sp. GP187]
MRNATPRPLGRRKGFSLVELMVACVISVGLIAIMVSMTASFERSASEVIARCELAQEADFAMARLADDLRGFSSTRPETRTLFMAPEELQLIFGDRTITYSVQNETLIRSVDPGAEPDLIVAHHLQHLQALRIDPQEPIFKFSLTFALPFREQRATPLVLERSYHLIAVLP